MDLYCFVFSKGWFSYNLSNDTPTTHCFQTHVKSHIQPRSYRVLNAQGNIVRRNRRDLPGKDRFKIQNDYNDPVDSTVTSQSTKKIQLIMDIVVTRWLDGSFENLPDIAKQTLLKLLFS